MTDPQWVAPGTSGPAEPAATPAGDHAAYPGAASGPPRASSKGNHTGRPGQPLPPGDAVGGAPGDGVPPRRDPAEATHARGPLRRRDQGHPRQCRGHHGPRLRHHPYLPGADDGARRVDRVVGVAGLRVDRGHLPGGRHLGSLVPSVGTSLSAILLTGFVAFVISQAVMDARSPPARPGTAPAVGSPPSGSPDRDEPDILFPPPPCSSCPSSRSSQPRRAAPTPVWSARSSSPWARASCPSSWCCSSRPDWRSSGWRWCWRRQRGQGLEGRGS